MAKRKGSSKGGGSRTRSGMDFAVSGIILAVAGVFIPVTIPYIEFDLKLGLILCFFAILLGVIAMVKSEKGAGLIAIAIGAIPFIQMAIGVVIGAFGDFDWYVSIGLMLLAIGIVIYILFIKK